MTLNSTVWVPFPITHVIYPKGDAIGWILALISLTPFAIFVSFVTLVVFKRELDTVFFMIGQMLNEILNVILKKIIRQHRPDAPDEPTSVHIRKTYGMPSQHSQFMSFFVTFCIIFIIKKMSHKPFYFRYPLVFLLLVTLLTVVYSRVYLLYHYWSQVLVGIAVGCLSALVWFNILYKFIRPYIFDEILSNPLFQFFGITCYRFPDEKIKQK